MTLQLHQALHRVCNSEAGLGHHLPRLLRDVRLRLHLAELVRVLSQLAQYLLALRPRRLREIVLANGDDTGYDRDDLRQVLVERRRRGRAAHAREHALDRVDDRLSLRLEVWLYGECFSLKIAR